MKVYSGFEHKFQYSSVSILSLFQNEKAILSISNLYPLKYG